MKHLMPLRRVVVEVTNEADLNNPEGIGRAVKSWHNRLSNGSIPRRLIMKLGRQLFLNLDAWRSGYQKGTNHKLVLVRGDPDLNLNIRIQMAWRSQLRKTLAEALSGKLGKHYLWIDSWIAKDDPNHSVGRGRPRTNRLGLAQSRG